MHILILLNAFNRCKLRVVDSFGTDAEFNYKYYPEEIPGGRSPWGDLNLRLAQFMTMYRKCNDYYLKLDHWVTQFKSIIGLATKTAISIALVGRKNYARRWLSPSHIGHALVELSFDTSTWNKLLNKYYTDNSTTFIELLNDAVRSLRTVERTSESNGLPFIFCMLIMFKDDSLAHTKSSLILSNFVMVMN